MSMMPAPRQTFRSRFGRPTITVTAECPTRVLRSRLSHTHVATPADEVEAMVSDAIAGQRAAGNGTWTTQAEKTAVRFALWQHEENRAEYAWVMGSH